MLHQLLCFLKLHTDKETSITKRNLAVLYHSLQAHRYATSVTLIRLKDNLHVPSSCVVAYFLVVNFDSLVQLELFL